MGEYYYPYFIDAETEKLNKLIVQGKRDCIMI